MTTTHPLPALRRPLSPYTYGVTALGSEDEGRRLIEAAVPVLLCVFPLPTGGWGWAAAAAPGEFALGTVAPDGTVEVLADEAPARWYSPATVVNEVAYALGDLERDDA